MASNLIKNEKPALKRCNIRSITKWADTAVVLHWLNRQGLYKQFVAIRVAKTLEMAIKMVICPNQSKFCGHRKQK